jgi:GDPmannose 4,6-dehydratase
MWRILQQEKPEDFVIATGIATTVRDFTRMAFAEAGIEIEFIGKNAEEKGIVISCNNEKYQLPKGKEVVAIDPNYFRPTEVDLLIGDAAKAREKLGWTPTYTLAEMIKEMVASDLETYKASLERKYYM